MADSTARDALQRGIASWLPTMSEDELRIVDAVITAILVAREDNASAVAPPSFVGNVDALERHLEQLDREPDTGPLDRINVGLAELRNAPAVSRTPVLHLLHLLPPKKGPAR